MNAQGNTAVQNWKMYYRAWVQDRYDGTLEEIDDDLDKMRRYSREAALERRIAALQRQNAAQAEEIDRLNRFLQTIINLGDAKKHAAFDGERHREMRHCANQALMTKNENYEP